MRVLTAIVGAASTAALTALGGPAQAGETPQRSTEVVRFQGTIDSCHGFDVVADFIFRSTLVEGPAGRSTIHLRLGGTLQNSETGTVGRYAEVQIDTSTRSGTAFSAGMLSRLTVPGRGTTALNAGRGGVDASGEAFFTPHATGVADYEAFHADVCKALA